MRRGEEGWGVGGEREEPYRASIYLPTNRK